MFIDSINTLGEIGLDENCALKTLNILTDSINEKYKEASIIAITKIDNNTDTQLKYLKSPNPKICQAALSGLLRINKYDDVKMSAVIELLGNDDISTNLHARDVLVHAGNRAIPELLIYLKNSTDCIRAECATVLGTLRGDPMNVIPVLIEYINNSNHNLRYNAILSLGMYGTLAKESLPLLKNILEKETDKEILEVTKMAIRDIEK
jgi:HEAT repeat protein